MLPDFRGQLVHIRIKNGKFVTPTSTPKYSFAEKHRAWTIAQQSCTFPSAHLHVTRVIGSQHHCQAGVRSRRFLGGVGVRFLTTLGVGVGFFCPTRDVQLDQFLHHTPKLGIPVEMVQFLLKLMLKQISCCVPRFPLILTAKFHSLCVSFPLWSRSWKFLKGRVGVGNFGKSESDILPPNPQPCCQVLWYSPVGYRNYTAPS